MPNTEYTHACKRLCEEEEEDEEEEFIPNLDAQRWEQLPVA